ncbi:hypothetical protein EJ07DRAFT_163025 [Lizonia empirigonia]|nr:hypothetical protein EJ07DRAFT_163025 [Lizonia empirigonia]
MPHSVYLVSYVGAPRDHHAIFVEMNSDLSGYIFQDSASFVAKSRIGTISEVDFARVQSVIEKILPPPKQFNGPKRISPSEPLRRCQEWTNEAIQALKDEGILQV